MKLINCYQGFYEQYNEDLTKEEQIEVWYNFMDQHKTVRDMCINDYLNEGLDWKRIALEKVFGYDLEFVLKMNETVRLLEKIVEMMIKRLGMFYSIDNINVVVVLYHGLGNGAGWVATYENKPAIYLGIEKILELGWNTRGKLEDLISHEFGHVIHESMRETLVPYDDFKRKTIFKLYTEGVATYCESIINGREKSSPEWYEKCLENELYLKKEFLRRLESNSQEITDFFGDWNLIYGIYEAGYFLGLQIVKRLIRKMTITELMKIDYEVFYNEFIKYFDLSR